MVTESVPYKVLQERASKLEHTVQESQAEATKLKEQLDNLTSSRAEFEVGMKVCNNTRCLALLSFVFGLVRE